MPSFPERELKQRRHCQPRPGVRVELRLPGITFRGFATIDDGEVLTVEWEDGRTTHEYPADLLTV